MADNTAGKDLVEGVLISSRRPVRTSANSYAVQRRAKLELKEKIKRVSNILKKSEQERTATEKALVKKNPDIVKTSQRNAKRLEATKSRTLEIEDETQILDQKCDQLADLLDGAERVVVYTGAGISTAASIPDYRGPNGVWTLLKKGQEPCAHDLSDAEPTFTHMSITKLFRAGLVKHVVSQNCDGLHIRSGYPRYALSEVHGNMYIECCYSCNPHKEYIRLFDVTERTGVRRHTTGRRCRTCGSLLTDTIVHFGEKGKIKSPYRWKEAVRAAKHSDLILCLGSSLKILRRYTCLWSMDKKPHQRPKLVIVNLQWTPKDDVATLKINGRCDYVMQKVMNKLEFEVPEYNRETDPIFKFCTPLRASELKTTSKKILIPPFLPAKTPTKAPKNSRPRKSQASKKRKKKGKEQSTITKPNVEESLVKEEKSWSKKEIPFSSLFGKSNIRADWDTPIFAPDPPDPLVMKAMKIEPDISTDSKPGITPQETFPVDEKPINSILASDIKTDSVIDSISHERQTNNMDSKSDSEDLEMVEHKVFDVEVKEEHKDGFDNICQLKLDDMDSSDCQVHLSKAHNNIIDKSSDSMALYQKDKVSNYINESLHLTQPIPGTVVIDLQIVDEDDDNFSHGKIGSNQFGMCSNNVLLINLNSHQSKEISISNRNANMKNYTCENNLCTVNSLGSALKEPLGFKNVSILQQRVSLNPISCSSNEISWKNKCDLKSPIVQTSNMTPYTISPALFPQPLAQSVVSPLSVSVSLNHETNSLSSMKGMSVTLSSQQQSFSSLPQSQLMSHLTSSCNHLPHGTSSSSSTSASSAGIFNWSRKSLGNGTSKGMQRESDLLLMQNMNKISFPPKPDESKQREEPGSNNKFDTHDKLRQLLNAPVSVDNQSCSSFHVEKAGKKLIPSHHQNENISSCADHPYSHIDTGKLKEHVKFQENIHTSNITHPKERLFEQCGGGNFSKSRVQFSPKYQVNNLTGLKEVRPSIRQDTMKAISPTTTLTKSGHGILSAKIINERKHNNEIRCSIPPCVLNMDDILKPELKDNYSNNVDSYDIKTCNAFQKTRQQEVLEVRSSSPFQAVSLISSLSLPCHVISNENVVDDGSKVSLETPLSNILTETLPRGTTINLSNGWLEDAESLKEATTLGRSDKLVTETTPEDTRMLVSLNNDVTSPKTQFGNTLSQSMKCNSIQNTKNPVKKGRKPEKRSINVVTDKADAKKTKKMASSDSLPGWFGKGLVIKRKRKQ